MASRLGERIDFALNYTVEGQDQLDAGAESLSKLNAAGTNVNEQTEVSRKILERFREEQAEVNEVQQQATVTQLDMATAISQTNEIVKEESLSLELLRLELDEGNISQEEYSERLDQMRQRLEETEVITMSSARALRAVSREQQAMTQETGASTGAMRQNIFALNRFSRIITAMPRGIGAVSSQLPFLAGSMARVGASASGTGSALSTLTAFLASPAGIGIAIATLIPLLITAANRLEIFKKEVIDNSRVAEGYVSRLQSMIDTLLEFRRIEKEGLQGLQIRLDNIIKTREEQEAVLEALKEERTEINRLAQTNQFNLINQERHREVIREIAIIEESIKGFKEEELEIEADILREQLLQESATAQALEDEARQIRLRRGLREINDMIYQEDLRRREERSMWLDEFYDRELERIREVEARRREIQTLLNQPPPARDTSGEEVESTQVQRALAREAFLQDARLAIIQNTTNREQAIRLEGQREFQRRRLELARQGILDEETLNALRIQNEKETQDRLLLLEEEKLSERERLLLMFAGELQGIGQLIHGDSEENAKKAFEVDKAFAMSSAIVHGALAITKALPDPVKTGLVAATVALQVAKIAATKFRSTESSAGSGAQRLQYDFRGAQANQTVPGARTTVNIPDRLVLEDSAGQMLTKLEYARDREGDAPYLSGSRRSVEST